MTLLTDKKMLWFMDLGLLYSGYRLYFISGKLLVSTAMNNMILARSLYYASGIRFT